MNTSIEDLRFKEATQRLLQHDMAIIPCTVLQRQIDIDAANLLVEHGLFIYREDLLVESDDWDSDGFIKLIPEHMDLEFARHLLKFDISPPMWSRTPCLPDVWKARLSDNSINYLNTMSIYRDQLNPQSQLLCVTGCVVDMDTEQIKDLGSHSRDFLVNQEADNANLNIKRIGKNPLANVGLVRAAGSFQSISCDMPTHDGNINKLSVIKTFNDKVFIKSRRKEAEKRTSDSQCFIAEDQSSSKRPRKENSTSDYIPELHHQSTLTNAPIMYWNQLRDHIIGLPNRTGNDCYINAAIQCLANTPPFVDYLLSQTDILFSCHLTKRRQFCSICELSQIVSYVHRLSNEDSAVVDHVNVAHSQMTGFPVDKLSSEFVPQRQEDASLFIISLLDHCAACLNSSVPTNPEFQRPNTVIDQIFGIKLLSTIECLSCSTISEKEEIFYLLSLEVTNLFSLTEALQHFFQPEILANSDAYHCSNCNDFVDAQKSLTIHELSPILIMNFKRSIPDGNHTRKLMHPIDYDELLDVSPYSNGQLFDNDSNNHNNRGVHQLPYYKLYGVIIHSGVNAENGHFFAYLRTSQDTWFRADDEHCEKVSLTDVLNHQSVFILFYAKVLKSAISNRALSNQEKPCSTLSQNDLVLKSVSSSDDPGTVNMSLRQFLSIADLNKPSFSRDFSSSIMCVTPSRNDSRTIETQTFSNNLSDVSVEKTPSREGPRPGYTESRITIEESKHAPERSATIENPSDYDSYMSTDEELNEVKVQKENRKELASIASGVEIQETFEYEVPPVYNFQLRQNNLVELKEIRQKELKKSHDQKLKAVGLQPEPDPSSTSFVFKTKRTIIPLNNITNVIEDLDKNDFSTKTKVDIEYFNILLPYLKHYNAACALCICTRYFGRNTSNPTSLLVKCILKCNGSDCPFKCIVHVFNDGRCFVVGVNRKIFHRVGERHSRPIRGSRRQRIKEKFKAGGSVYRVHAEYDQQRTINEKRGFNYDATGKSKKVFKKIKAECVSESLLSPGFQIGILHLHDQLVDKINNDGTVKGALQLVQLRPFCVVSYMESSVRLYDAIATHPNSVLSWDATGGIVKCFPSTTKQILYYELTLAHPNVVNEDTLIPLTFMLSESQSLKTVVQWLTTFKESYKKVYPHKKDDFPRPAVILSDRAQVFLQGALRVFNEESYEQFLTRAYRIVTKKALPDDLSKTNIHACLAHFMLDMRKLVNRYLAEDIREIGMWSIALLVNTNTWTEIKNNWRLICLVFWNYDTTDNVDVERYSAILLSRIEQISNEKNVSEVIKYSRSLPPTSHDTFDFDDAEDEADGQQGYFNEKSVTSKSIDKRIKSRASRVKNDRLIVDEEQEFNQADSSFKRDLQEIFSDCCQDTHSIRHVSSSISKITKGARDWLSYIMKNTIPTIPLWSNLLLGNYSRYTNASIRAFNKLLITTHDQRTNSISERRMCIVKRTQLGSQTRMRPDVVLQILVQDMQRMTEAFSLSLLSQSIHNNSNTQQQKLKEISEQWSQSNRRGRGYYAKKPESTVMLNLKSALIVSSSTINDNLSLPDLSAPNWLNVSIGLLLSIATIRQSPPRPSLMTTPLLIDVANFIENWILISGKTRSKKKTSAIQKRLLNTDFDVPLNIPNDPTEQSTFLLHDVLLPIIAQPMLATKTYICTACKFSIRTHFMINYIPINVVDGQLLFHNELTSYFISSTSDVLCSKCSFPMTRRIELLDCPSVIIIAVNDIQTTTRISRKPPSTYCFQSFMDPSSIGCPTSTIFDIVGFLSITPSTTTQKLALVTRMGKRWQINSTKKMIGDGEQLCQFFARSRIIILERVRTSSTNFLFAIAQCCSISNILADDLDGSCKTMRDAVKQIEKIASLQHLQLTLSSNITNYYQCPNCLASPNSLTSTYDCICIYQQTTSNSEITALPFIWNTDLLNLQCSACRQNIDNRILTTYTQTHQRCPFTLMYHSRRMTRDQVINLRIKLVDNCTRLPHIYHVVSVILVDEYNSISLIKFCASNGFTVYCQNPYTTPVSLSDTDIDDLFTTARSNVLFCQTVNDTDLNGNQIEISQPVRGRTNNKLNASLPLVASSRSDQIVMEEEQQADAPVYHEDLSPLNIGDNDAAKTSSTTILNAEPFVHMNVSCPAINSKNGDQRLSTVSLPKSSQLKQTQQAPARLTAIGRSSSIVPIVLRAPFTIRLTRTSSADSMVPPVPHITIMSGTKSILTQNNFIDMTSTFKRPNV